MTKDVPVIELKGIRKSFGAVAVLYGIDLAVAHGEVVGLVGDNGAGKSTLIKIICGVHGYDAGEMAFEGRKVRIASPREARAIGIEPVYQDLAMIEDLTVWRNFFIGREVTRPRLGVAWMDVQRMRRDCMTGLAQLGIEMKSPDVPVRHLSGGERQSVAIARAVYFGARLLILDEPTAALAVKETQKVMDAIAEARAHGLGVIVIMHNLEQVVTVADRIILMAHGRILGQFSRGERSVGDISRMLVTANVDMEGGM